MALLERNLGRVVVSVQNTPRPISVTFFEIGRERVVGIHGAN